MTVLSACQDAIARLVARKPNSVFASDEEICVEIASLANEAATDIAKASSWQALSKLYSVTGDGVTSEWPLPIDYDRMVQGTDIDSGLHVPGLCANYWSLFQNKIVFSPDLDDGQEAMFYYIVNRWAVSASGTSKNSFDRDDDVFILSNRLLTLALIWRWKSMKGMDYQEDIKNYDIALSQEMTSDRGARTIRKGFDRFYGHNVHAAWPWALG